MDRLTFKLTCSFNQPLCICWWATKTYVSEQYTVSWDSAALGSLKIHRTWTAHWWCWHGMTVHPVDNVFRRLAASNSLVMKGATLVGKLALAAKGRSSQSVFGEVKKVLELYLMVPMSNTKAEGSFSVSWNLWSTKSKQSLITPSSSTSIIIWLMVWTSRECSTISALPAGKWVTNGSKKS